MSKYSGGAAHFNHVLLAQSLICTRKACIELHSEPFGYLEQSDNQIETTEPDKIGLVPKCFK